MKRKQIELNWAKYMQLKDYEDLRRKLIEGQGMWWGITSPKHISGYATHITDDGSRKRFMAWLESEIALFRKELELEEEL